MIKLLRKIGNFFNPFVNMLGSKENRAKGSGIRYTLRHRVLFAYFKKAPLIDKVFQDGKYHFRVINKKLSGGRWKCQVVRTGDGY